MSSFPDSTKTNNYLKTDGTVRADISDSASLFPQVGSGSYGGAFGGGDFGNEITHPFNFYLNDK